MGTFRCRPPYNDPGLELVLGLVATRTGCELPSLVDSHLVEKAMKKLLISVTLAALIPLGSAHAGVASNALTLNGLQLNGLKSNGFRLNGLHMNGLHMNGLHMNGLHMNGLHMNGLHMNGLHMNGLHMNGLRRSNSAAAPAFETLAAAPLFK